jgi:hypothetical protein
MPLETARHLRTDVLVLGGGLGGVACAQAAARLGMEVTLVEELDWLGGQVSAQGVPFDEHPWNETVNVSRSYSAYREDVRRFYLDRMPLASAARRQFPLNPGHGYVSTLAHDPRVSAWVLEAQLAPYVLPGRLRLLKEHRIVHAHVKGDRIAGATVQPVHGGGEIAIDAKVVVDCTETGDFIELAGVEHSFGAESKADTGELHALDVADPSEQQGFNWTFAVEWLEGEDHTIERPDDYAFWREWKLPYWPGIHFGFMALDHFTGEPRPRPLFAGDSDSELIRDMWHFRRIARRRNFEPGVYRGDVAVFCTMQNEYLRRPLLGIDAAARAQVLQDAKRQSLSFLYWMQTEAPRPDGGAGYPGMMLRRDVFSTADGLSKQPYTREGRRIAAEFRLLEQHVGVAARPGAAAAENFDDTVGIAAYRLNIHPTVARDAIDIDCFPYQISLGMLLPQRADGLVAGNCKTVGSTRVTCGSLRHHPIDWVVGEAAGATAAHAVKHSVPPRAIRADPGRLRELQHSLCDLGAALRWPDFTGLKRTHAMAASFQELYWRAHGPRE